MEVANCARTEVRGLSFVTFDVAMQGHVIATVDAPLLSGCILWSHAAIHGYRDFDARDKGLLEREVGRVLFEPAAQDWAEAILDASCLPNRLPSRLPRRLH